MLSPHDFFDFDQTAHTALFDNTEYVWQAIDNISGYIHDLLAGDYAPNSEQIEVHPTVVIEGDVHIGEGTTIAPHCYIQGPTVIGNHCEIRQGAFIRSDVLVADKAIVGHASEVKHSVLLENAHAPHFAYVGDSILGRNVNLGAGTKLSNLPVNSTKDPATGKRSTIHLTIDGTVYDTELAKFGVIFGDDVQTGCNAVMNPGCVVGRDTWIYPLVSLSKGYYPPHSLVKLRQTVQVVEKR
ncbi:MAG: glucose-1-phosphate thymidylyltransferase [Chloroflexota bacterium]